MAKFVLVAIVTLFMLSSMAVMTQQGQIHNTNRVLLAAGGHGVHKECRQCCEEEKRGEIAAGSCSRRVPESCPTCPLT